MTFNHSRFEQKTFLKKDSMKKCRHLLIAFFAIIGSLSVQAQDIHFSQFYMSPLNLNPAMTGVMNCNVRLTGNYRNQWASVLRSNAFNTYSVSYDQRIPVGRYDYFGIGGTFWGDVAGQSRFGTVTGKLSASFSKRMGGYRDKTHYLVMGVEGGVSQRSLDFLALQYGNQHDGQGGFDPTASSGEGMNFTRDNFIFADLSAGLLWFSVLDKNNNFYLGAAYHHLNQSNQSFGVDDFEPLYARFTIHGGGEFEMTRRVSLVPGAVVFLQGPSMQVNAGTSFRFLLGNSRRYYQAFQIGGWLRLAHKLEDSIHADAFILSTRFEYEDFGIGFSYDLNVSSLSPASNNNGGFEFSLIYKVCGPEKRGLYCPNF